MRSKLNQMPPEARRFRKALDLKFIQRQPGYSLRPLGFPYQTFTGFGYFMICNWYLNRKILSIIQGTLEKLDEDETAYILGTRMRKVKRINTGILTHAGRYSQVYPESDDRKKPAPLKVKEVVHEGTRYVVCLNERQARKDGADREAIALPPP